MSNESTSKVSGAGDPGSWQGDLLKTLLKHDLVDTFRIWQFPLVLGSGKRLFGEGAMPGGFRLVDTRITRHEPVMQRLSSSNGTPF